MEMTQIQEAAAIIKSSGDAINQSFTQMIKNQSNLNHWQGLGAAFFASQLTQLNQYFERQNQVIYSYHLVLKNCLSESHIETERVNLMLSNQIK